MKQNYFLNSPGLTIMVVYLISKSFLRCDQLVNVSFKSLAHAQWRMEWMEELTL